MTRPWRVTPAGLEHARGIAECHIESWREAYSTLVPAHVLAAFDLDRRTAVVARRLGPAVRTGGERTHVALADDEVIGFATVTTFDDPARAELDALYVRRDRYGTGVADELVRTAVAPAIPCLLWVFTGAERARAFYRRHGWAPDGAHRFEEFTALPQVRMSRRPGGAAHSPG